MGLRSPAPFAVDVQPSGIEHAGMLNPKTLARPGRDRACASGTPDNRRRPARVLAGCVAGALTCIVLAGAVRAGEAPVKRESIEWCNLWITHANEQALPRVLLLGDSITQAYYGQVERELAGRAYVGRLTTSKSLGDPALLDEVAGVLKQYRFDVIHFNNGMHGWGYTELEYARAFPRLLATLKHGAPAAKLIWASTTPVREGQDLRVAAKTQRVRARNQIARALVTRKGIPVDDLFGLMIDRPEFSSPDGVHASSAGITAQATQVAESIGRQLPQKGLATRPGSASSGPVESEPSK